MKKMFILMFMVLILVGCGPKVDLNEHEYWLNKYVTVDFDGVENDVDVNVNVDLDGFKEQYELQRLDLVVNDWHIDKPQNIKNGDKITVEYEVECKENKCLNSTYNFNTKLKVHGLKTKEQVEKEEKERKIREEKLEKERKAEEEKLEKERKKQEEIDNASFGKRQALEKAIDYIDYSAFSKEGLYDQLKFEGFTSKEARFAVKHIDVSWKKQALLKGQDYLDYSSFSKQGLYDQLIFEKFTKKQARYAVNKLYK